MAEYGNMVRRVSSFTQCKKEVSEETTLNSWISLIWMIKNWLGQLVDWLLDESGELLGEATPGSSIFALTREITFLGLCPFFSNFS